eukprot:CAMPEP_0197527376 /NCGR_PEP_ID=MMETSP1318-20131121/21326_1 /TAXON_ID=552666 /ORGANISM="Partenskyella glossopodia, Strain RCC365" /LENGTH=513 /DNA_ID=CAMNT_0043081981 /DNA_START=66 /DNA_END=1607 /DNA_ORIENTATION=-
MSRAVLQVFEKYQAARTAFVQTVAELAHRPQNIEALQNAGVMQLLRPLLLDTVASIQQSAALALGRLANYSEELAEAVVMNEVLPQLVYSLEKQNRFYKKTAAFVLKAVAKHSPQLAKAVVDAKSLDALVGCLREFEPSVKEAACWALGYIARHTAPLAQAVVDAGAVPLLVLCLQEPELSLKRIAASTMGEICKHSPELAQVVVDQSGVPFVAQLVTHHDSKLKRQVCQCLSQIAKHSVDLAEVVVETEIFTQTKLFSCLKDSDPVVRRNAATCIREVVKHAPELAQLVVNNGGHAAVIDYVNKSKGASRLPGIMTLGYIAAFSPTLATILITAQGIRPLKDALINEPEDHIKAASAWSLGQIGRHSPDHAQALAVADVFRRLVEVFENENSSTDLKQKSQRALKSVLQKCTHYKSLEPLLLSAPPKILKYIVGQFAKILPTNPKARKSFVQSKGLQKIQELKMSGNNDLLQYIDVINKKFPPEIVDYYSPNYAEKLLQKIETNDDEDDIKA